MSIPFNRAFERSGLPEDQREAYRLGWNDCIDFLQERRGNKKLPGSDGRNTEALAFCVGLLCLMLWASFLLIYALAYFEGGNLYPNLRPFSELAPYIGIAFAINIWCARVWWKSAGRTEQSWNERWGKK